MKEKYMFLSYSHIDVDVIAPFISTIKARHRLRYDTNIGAAREYNDEIAKMIDDAAIVVSFISRHYIASSYCIDEILYARNKELPILLVYLEDTKLSAGMSLRLGRFQALSFYADSFLRSFLENPEIRSCAYETDASEPEPEEPSAGPGLIEVPETVSLDDLRSFDGSGGAGEAEGDAPWTVSASLGLVYREEKHRYEALTLDLCRRGSCLVLGIPMSGKSTLLQTVVYSLSLRYSPERLHFYLLDFGNYMLECFSGIPHVSALVNDQQKERAGYVLKHLVQTIEERRGIIRGGDIQEYNSIRGSKLPAVLLVIDDLNRFLAEVPEELTDDLLRIARDGFRYGVYLLAAGSELPGYRARDLKKYIRNHLCFELYSREQYADVWEGEKPQDIPAAVKKPGHGLTDIEHSILPFQAAVPILADNAYVREQILEKRCLDIRQKWEGMTAPQLFDFPLNFDLEDFFSHGRVKVLLESGDDRVPVACSVEDYSVVALPVDTTPSLLVCGRRSADVSYGMRVLLEAAARKRSEVFVFDGSGGLEYFTQKYPIHYASDPGSFAEALNSALIPMLRTRKEQRESAADGSCTLSPIFIFIDDLSAFADLIQRRGEEWPGLSELISLIIKRDKNVSRVTLAGGVSGSVSFRSGLRDMDWYNDMRRAENVIFLGGRLSDHSLASDIFQTLPYRQQNELLKKNEAWFTLNGRNASRVLLPAL